MNKIGLPSGLTRTFGKLALQLKKHSPEILVGVGVVGVVGSTVLACKATLKAQPIIAEAKKNMIVIKDCAEHPEQIEGGYTNKDRKSDTAIVCAHTALKLAKEYAPAVILGAASLGCIIGSHRILTKRNVALVAAYKAVDGSFKEYRKNVIERFGQELDKELKYGITTQEVEEKVIDEKGKEKTVKKTVQVINNNEPSEYSKFFDMGCAGWMKDAEHNLWVLKSQQKVANQMLKSKGYLFLNEVYELLGIPKTRAGQVVGWMYDTKKSGGDGYVDFGIYDVNRPRNMDFVNGYERSILLDFNVDGPILDLI